jgi:undecaprenyl-diphosphatase
LLRGARVSIHGAVSFARNSSDSPSPASVSNCGWRPLVNALLAAVGLLLFGLAFAADAPVRNYVQANLTPAQQQAADLLSKYGKAEEFLALAVLGWIVGRLTRRVDWQRRWLLILAAILVAGIAVNIPRSLTGRVRPNNPKEQGWFGPRHDGQWLVGRYQYNSFPSGHSTVAGAFAFAAILCFRRAGWLAVPFALAIGWARIGVSAHHFSDVVVGLVFGAVLAGCVWSFFRARGWLGQGSSRPVESAV